MGQGAGADPMLVTDADRERTIDLLAHHQAAGRFGLDELERRVELVYAAKSRSELAHVLDGLPPLAAGSSGGPGTRTRSGSEPRPAGWGRGHAEADRPGAGWMPTDERFRDPRTRRVMRVWVDPGTGARHYVPDETG
jgi:hypothetical protein